MSEGLETYFQATYSAGFISIGQDLTMLTRSLLVASTLGGDMLALHKLTPQISTTGSALENQEPLTARPWGYLDMSTGPTKQDNWGIADYPQTRSHIRRICTVASITFWVAVIFSTVAGGDYQNAVDSGAHAGLVRNLWCVRLLVFCSLMYRPV